MANFTVVGAGAWGTALAAHAARLGHAVTVWALEAEVADEITTRHSNSIYLSGCRCPSPRATSDSRRRSAAPRS
jgi:glycerol-3-phosphate dehydrogenase (NAD(P)+)